MNDFRLYELLKKQQKNKLSPEEEQVLNDWFDHLDHTPEQEAPIPLIKARIWSAISLRVNARLRTGIGSRTAAPNHGRVSPEKTTSVRWIGRIGWRGYAAAASVIVVLACAALYFKTPQAKPVPAAQQAAIALTTIRAPHGSQARVTLSDGTVVWLNGDAVLDYPAVFDTVRNVYLRHGEAFFEVAANAGKPFIVHSQHMHTQVLGTSFDIRNAGGRYMVAVASGKVKVYYSGRERAQNISNMLEAGERLTTDSIGSRSVVDSLDKDLCKGWTDKAYHLKDVSLTGIAFCMESIYGVTIRIRSEELKKLTFTTSVSNKDRMQDILERLSLAGDFHYKINAPDTVTIY